MTDNETLTKAWGELSQHGLLWGVSLMVLLLLLAGCLRRRKLSHKYMSGRWYVVQVAGALLKSWWGILAVLLMLVAVQLLAHGLMYRYCLVGMSVLLMGITSYVVTSLNQVFSLRRQETRITISQILLLAVFGLCAGTAVWALDIDKNSNGYVIISSMGVILGWIFQDTIKSVVAFFYLRANGLLRIGDWIELESKGINGIVRSITLTTVQLENWDTTTSAFPVYLLHAEHFKNKQRMLEGRTHGRLMQRTLVVDAAWVRQMSEDDKGYLYDHLPTDEAFRYEMLKTDGPNLQFFRRYVHHYLMQHTHVCQYPRLFVGWRDQTAEGITLQLYAFLTDTAWDAFEWQQSAIIEHILSVLPMFHLRLYQRPSGYDAHHTSVSFTHTEADYHNIPES